MTKTVTHELTENNWTILATNVRFCKLELIGYNPALIHIGAEGLNHLDAPVYVVTPRHREVDLDNIKKRDFVYARSKHGITSVCCISDGRPN